MTGAPRPDAEDAPLAVLPRAARRAVRLTLAGLWWERLARSFWAAAALAVLGGAALALGLVAALPAGLAPWPALVWALFLSAAALAGWRRFRRPSLAEALARVDARLPGAPLAALGDRMALGGPGAAALWQAHLAQSFARAAAARPVPADAGLSRRDPFALRLVALTALAMALIFGQAGGAGRGLAALAAGWKPPARPSAAPSAPAGPAWEGWAEPPRHTGRPTIYLNALRGDALTVPEGTILSFRLYGQGVAVEQDVGAPPEGAAPDPAAPRFVARQGGRLRVGGRELRLTVEPDAPPSVQLAALAGRRADGKLVQGFAASDDHGVTAGQAEITLDLAAVDRRHGLGPAPEPRPPVTIALPVPATGQRRDIRGTLAADLARHPWANLPVRLRLTVRDALDQSGTLDPQPMILPGRRFFDPLAAGLVEMRRDLLWSRDNAARSARLLRAMVWRPDRPIPPEAEAAVVAAVRTLESPPLTPAARDAVADRLWDAALQIEDGGLGDALDRMRQAQQRLSEAIRNGASPDEIGKLMDALKAATDDYLRLKAERGPDPAARFDRAPSEEIDGDQIQQMMDEIQRLMNAGRMAEAQELLDQLSRLMENLQVREGGSGGQGGPGARPMERLGEALREQQKLADEALREAQRDPFGLGPDAETGEDGDGGQPGAPQPGEGGQAGAAPAPGAPGDDPSGAEGPEGPEGGPRGDDASAPGGAEGTLAQRQRALREDLARQRALMPGRGTSEGESAGAALDDAGRAMTEAEQALRDGDPAGALDRQAAAIEALREGMRALGRLEQAERGQQGDQGAPQPGDGQTPGPQGSASPQGGEGQWTGRPQRDPLGRDSAGQGGNVTTGEALADGERQAGRARELQDEIRRRSGEPGRPGTERDYLGRLLDRF